MRATSLIPMVAVCAAILPAAPAQARVIHPWHHTIASTYGYCGIPGEPCGGMACTGKRVTRGTWAVAHKTLRCGTRLKICVRHVCHRARVQDRGPYVAGRDIDLTWRLGRALHVDGIAKAKWKIIR